MDLKNVSAEEMLKMVYDPRLTPILMAMDANRASATQMAQVQSILKGDWTTTDALIANPTIYGRNSIFDPCFTGDIFGLQIATHGLLNWLGWRPNKYYKRTVQFIPWWRPEGAEEGITGAGSPCEDPMSWEWGECSYELCHTSWYHRQGQPLGPHNTQDRCETDQRVRINGTPINNEFEWQLNGIMKALKQDLQRDAVHGSHLNAYEMNGLESVVRRGYRDNNGNFCPYVDSWLIDWNYDDLNGVLNGWGVFFDFLNELINQVEYRASALGTIADKDMALFTSRFMADCILDAFACYSVCGVTATGDITDQALRAQVLTYRQSLNGGPLYDGRKAVGYIKFKNGRRMGILVDDAFDITKPNANYCTDVYLLTRNIGGERVFYGEFLNLTQYSNLMKKFNNATGIRVEAGGRFAFKGKEDNWCGIAMAGMSPEFYLSAPWAQARIMNVCCSRRFQPITGDPFQPDYMPGGRPLYPASSWGMECTDVPVGVIPGPLS